MTANVSKPANLIPPDILPRHLNILLLLVKGQDDHESVAKHCQCCTDTVNGVAVRYKVLLSAMRADPAMLLAVSSRACCASFAHIVYGALRTYESRKRTQLSPADAQALRALGDAVERLAKLSAALPPAPPDPASVSEADKVDSIEALDALNKARLPISE